MSLNLWNFNFWSQRQALLKREIETSRPDVIGLQEVRVAWHAPTRKTAQTRSQVAALAAMLPGWQYLWVPAMSFQEGETEYHAEGLAIFSRLPVVDASFIRLSRDARDPDDFHQRLCLRLAVRSFIGVTNVFSTHLSLSHPARARTLPEIRKVRVSGVCVFRRRLRCCSTRPLIHGLCVLCGPVSVRDFLCSPGRAGRRL